MMSLALNVSSLKSDTHFACKDSASASAGVFNDPPKILFSNLILLELIPQHMETFKKPPDLVNFCFLCITNPVMLF